MICGALQTLNEEAFEDVASTERGAGSTVAPGETLSQQLAPIREGSEFSASMDSGLSVTAAFNNLHNNCNNNATLLGGARRSSSSSGSYNNLQGVGGIKSSTNHLSAPMNLTELLIGGVGRGGGDNLNCNYTSKSFTDLSRDNNPVVEVEVGDGPQQLNKYATVVVMSQYPQNLNDTSL